MSIQTASGMIFLEQKKVIHRDLALRNLLVTTQKQKYVVKIGDFGLARDIEMENAYKTSDRQLPYKWCSPEVLEFGNFTIQSDIWAFGIVLWEMYSYGREPYPGFTTDMTIEKVMSGYTMDIPEGCPPKVGELIQRCWALKPSQRPSFQQIYDELQKILSEQQQILPVVIVDPTVPDSGRYQTDG